MTKEWIVTIEPRWGGECYPITVWATDSADARWVAVVEYGYAPRQIVSVASANVSTGCL